MTLPSQTPVVVTRIQNRRGTQTQFESLYPVGYSGVGGFGDPAYPGFNDSTYPNVLLPGELALCTDSRRAFIGNVNGEYIEFETATFGNSLDFLPVPISLPPTATYTVIPELEVDSTPFQKILYSLTDAASLIANSVGVNFSRNGELNVTANSVTATLVDDSVESNSTLYTAFFVAQYNVDQTKINILYKHDFPSNLVFSTGTIRWITL